MRHFCVHRQCLTTAASLGDDLLNTCDPHSCQKRILTTCKYSTYKRNHGLSIRRLRVRVPSASFLNWYYHSTKTQPTDGPKAHQPVSQQSTISSAASGRMPRIQARSITVGRLRISCMCRTAATNRWRGHPMSANVWAAPAVFRQFLI
jgi:hypothetical protein